MRFFFTVVVMLVTSIETGNIYGIYSTGGDSPKEVVIFGDSISDTGNLLGSTQVMPLKPYWKGRFSNGPVWVDYFCQYLDVPCTNLSYGGATTSAGIIQFAESWYHIVRAIGKNEITGNLENLIKDYIAEAQTMRGSEEEFAKKLFIYWGGANNLLDIINYQKKSLIGTDFSKSKKLDEFFEMTFDDIEKSLDLLVTAGADTILLPNLPLYPTSPYISDNEEGPLTEYLIERFNQRLISMVRNFQLKMSQKYPGRVMRIESVDINATLKEISVNPELFRFKNIKDRCFFGNYWGHTEHICDNPQEYFYFEDVHASSRAHCWMNLPILESALTIDLGMEISLSQEGRDNYFNFCEETFSQMVMGQ